MNREVLYGQRSLVETAPLSFWGSLSNSLLLYIFFEYVINLRICYVQGGQCKLYTVLHYSTKTYYTHVIRLVVSFYISYISCVVNTSLRVCTYRYTACVCTLTHICALVLLTCTLQ